MGPLLVTAAIIEHEGKILTTRRRADAPYPHYWELPGGKVEKDEDPRDCVVREIREELAIEVRADKIFEVVHFRYPERTVLVMAYCCTWLSGEIVELEVAGHCWVKPCEMLDFELLPADVPIVEKLAREADRAHLAGV